MGINKVDNELAVLIRDSRIKANLSQLELATRLNSSVQFISLIETCRSKAPVSMLGQLIAIINLPEDKIKKLIIEGYKEDLKNSIELGKNETPLSGSGNSKPKVKPKNPRDILIKKIYKFTNQQISFLEDQIRTSELFKTPSKRDNFLNKSKELIRGRKSKKIDNLESEK